MRLVKPYAKIINISHENPTIDIDRYGRTCYKSTSPESGEKRSKFIRSRIEDGHESIIEHATVTVKVVCDRGVSHELVRHRLASYSQESTRYCDYSDNISFIIPLWTSIEEGYYDLHYSETVIIYDKLNSLDTIWIDIMFKAEESYSVLLDCGWSPQQARSVLPNSLKTELIMTANLREWRTIFKLRCDKAAHPQMREIMIPLLKDFYTAMPDFFFDLYEKFFGGTDERKESEGLA